MKIRYDAEVDALSIVFQETTVTTQELAEGISAEYDALGRLVGIEILDAAKRLGDGARSAEITVEGLGLSAPSVPAA
jgi:YD repeat-containing protein